MGYAIGTIAVLEWDLLQYYNTPVILVCVFRTGIGSLPYRHTAVLDSTEQAAKQKTYPSDL